ncbi:alpha/beta-hydrolase [Polyporus arcularius HHB13444]|uniref:Alpha/beta-hydrolase n=1 Tax=Polyporus arcularius HHB13444 TaxID=1314778 RepID=A0A5C3PLI3_9APHY|nr:alpha/beta-hydrolase [Polyporus arcularius HHB13444]
MNRKAEGTLPIKSSTGVVRVRSKTLNGKARVVLVALTIVVLSAAHYTFIGPSPPAERPNSGTQAREFSWEKVEPSRQLEWTSCYSDNRCARLLLPLDYDTPDGPTTAIAIRMIPATDQDIYRGTIFLNPGGPGGSGVDFLERVGTNISRIVGPSFDILSFDPRGIGRTTPLASCFETASQRAIWATQEGHQLIDASDESLGIIHARAEVLAERCKEQLGGEWGIGRFATTPYVARDMLEITQLLGQEQLQYWGFSYGSILGQYFAAMYPDKVKRVVVDGVCDAEYYRAPSWDTDLVYTEDVVESLFTYCHLAGPEKCPIYDTSAAKIRERFFDVLDGVEKDAVPVALAEPPVVITRKVLMGQLFRASYKPLAAFPLVAATIHALESRNQTALTALAKQIISPTECNCESSGARPIQSEASFVIECADGGVYPYDVDAFRRQYANMSEASPNFAPMWASSWVECADWKIRPKWEFTAPLEAANTSHPLLVVSTRYDPVTPLTHARRVSKKFGGAALLTQESYGHCSISAPSLCTAKHIRAYFVNGTLPEEGSTCEVDELPLVGPTVRALSTEDKELLGALRSLVDFVPSFGRL